MYFGSSTKHRCKARIATEFFRLPWLELLSEVCAKPPPPSSSVSMRSFFSFGAARCFAMDARWSTACSICLPFPPPTWEPSPPCTGSGSSSSLSSSLSLKGPLWFRLVSFFRGSSSRRLGFPLKTAPTSWRCFRGTPAARAACTASLSRPGTSAWSRLPLFDFFTEADTFGVAVRERTLSAVESFFSGCKWPIKTERLCWICSRLASNDCKRSSCLRGDFGGHSGTAESAVTKEKCSLATSTKPPAEGRRSISPSGLKSYESTSSLTKSSSCSSSLLAKPTHTLQYTPERGWSRSS